MSEAHIRRSEAIWSGWRVNGNLTRTLCGLDDYNGAPSGAAQCNTCQRLDGEDHGVWPPREFGSPTPAALNTVMNQATTEYGYLIPPTGTQVWRRVSPQDVQLVPAWESDTVHYLLKDNRLTRGGLVSVRDAHGPIRMNVLEVS